MISSKLLFLSLVLLPFLVLPVVKKNLQCMSWPKDNRVLIYCCVVGGGRGSQIAIISYQTIYNLISHNNVMVGQLNKQDIINNVISIKFASGHVIKQICYSVVKI